MQGYFRQFPGNHFVGGLEDAMNLEDRIAADLKDAMKSRDAQRTSCLRMMRAEILNIEKEGKGKPDDAAIVQILTRMVRQRGESIEQYKAGGRGDLVAVEEAELAILRTYLPEEISGEEISAAVQAAIEASGATSLKDMGRVIGQAMKALKETGKTIDGSAVSAVVKEKLS
jgi:uncharacterized protein YqeY